MKKIYLLLICLGVFTSSLLQAQIHNNSEIPTSINDSGVAPEASAILDINAANKGILIPRMTMAARNAIANPATSLMIYQMDNTPGFYYYDGTAWTPVNSGVDTQLSEAEVDAFVANNGYVTTSDDADNDPTNELQDISGIAVNASDIATNTAAIAAIDVPTDNAQLANGAGYVTTSEDADNDPTNEIEIPTGGTLGQVLATDGSGNYSWTDKTVDTDTQLDETAVDAFVANNGYVTSADDADADPTNEVITGATLSGTDLEITDAGGTTSVDLSSLQDGIDDADADPTNEIEIPVGGILSTCNRDDALYTANGFSYIGKTALDVGTEVTNTEAWTAISTTNAPSGSFWHASVWTGTDMIVWGGTGAVAGKYNLATDTWTAISTTNMPANRNKPTAVWTGTEMIVWGGSGQGTGGRYNPTTDTWTATSMTNAPSGRDNHTAIWTGTEMIIWGGSNQDTGGRYDPATDTWTATSTTNAPTGRQSHAAVWTGTEMVIFGSSNPATGGRYNPATDTWTATSTTNAPTGSGTGVWTGDKVLFYGSFNTGSSWGVIYDPAVDTWTAMAPAANPVATGGHVAHWSGTEMLVYGGSSGNTTFNGVIKYNPTTDTWSSYFTGAPGSRSLLTAVWTGTEFITWGGHVAFFAQNNGGRYNPGGISEVTTTADYYMYKKD